MAEKKIKIETEIDSSQIDKSLQSVKSYAAQIRDLKKELATLGPRTAENAKDFDRLTTSIRELGEKQEDIQFGTKKVDDALGALPGPIGGAARAFKSFDDTLKNAKSGFRGLVETFPILQKAIVASGIGALVLILGGLIAAVVKAAKSFEPLQRATEKIGIAMDMFMELLKPVTDFILNAVVGAMELLAKGIALVSGNLDEFNKKASDAAATAALEKNLKKQEAFLDANGDKYDQYTQRKMKANVDYNKKVLEIDKDETLSAKQKEELKVQYRLKANREIERADQDRQNEQKKADEAAAKEAAAEAKRRSDEALNRKKGDLDAQIELEIQKENTSRDELKKLLDARMKLELQQAGLSEAQKEVIRRNYAKRLEDALKEDTDKQEAKRKADQAKLAADLDAQIELEIAKENTSQEKLKEILDQRMAIELDNKELTEAQKDQIRQKYAKRLETALNEDREKAKQRTIKAFEDEFALAGENFAAQLQAYENFNAKLVTMTEFNEKEKAEIRAKYAQAILAGLDKTQQSEMVMIDANIDQKKGKDKDYYDAVDATYKKQATSLKTLLDKGVIDQETYNIKNAQLSQARIQTAEAERQAQITAWQQIGQALTQLGELAGKETRAGKVLAAAGIAIDTAIAIAGIVRQATKNPTNLTPFQLAADIALRSVMVLTNIAKAKQILSSANTEGGEKQTAPQAPQYSVRATRATGGLIEGGGGSITDSVLARVSSGEYVMNARSTEMFFPIIDSMNEMGKQANFAVGGLFGSNKKKQRMDFDLRRKMDAQRNSNVAPIKTYVTAVDMSNQQQFNRQIRSRSLL